MYSKSGLHSDAFVEIVDGLQTGLYSLTNKNGCEVKVINKVVSVYDTNGKLLRTESITDYTKKNIIDTYATIETFTSKWNALKRKSEIAEMLKEAGIDLAVLKHDRNMDDVDDFDFICHIAYGKKTLTRRERAEQVKKRDVFSKYGEQARLVVIFGNLGLAVVDIEANAIAEVANAVAPGDVQVPSIVAHVGYILQWGTGAYHVRDFDAGSQHACGLAAIPVEGGGQAVVEGIEVEAHIEGLYIFPSEIAAHQAR